MNKMSAISGIMNEKERLAELSRLKNSYAMYEKAKKESVEKRKNMVDQFGNKKYSDNSIDSTIEIITNMQNDIVEQYVLYGGDKNELLEDAVSYEYYSDVNTNVETADDTNAVEVFTNDTPASINIGSGVMEYLSKLSSNEKTKTNTKVETKAHNVDMFDVNKVKEQFDLIPLPSGGEPYVNKLAKIPVGYLTAYDENIIVSPNLYKDGTFLDYLLKAKILNPAIDAGDLLPGDRDAVILWLRATGYGNEFPVTVTDDETGREFSAIIDLSKIAYKEFNLKADENGWFDYTLPVTKDEIKFNFLTHNEQNEIIKKDEDEDMGLKKEDLKKISDKLMKYKRSDLSGTVNKQFTKRIDEAIKTIDDWYDKITVENKFGISHTLTNRMIKMIKSVNGVTDPKFIREYVVKMNIKDAASFRKYVLENEPGLDYSIDVERPESLGGGSMTTFLSLDQYIFLNIS